MRRRPKTRCCLTCVTVGSGGAPADKPSVNLVETIRHAVQRQAWFVAYLQEQGAEPLPFVGRFTTASKVVQVAQDIRDVLGVDVEHGQRS
jgi:hypothetical protein